MTDQPKPHHPDGDGLLSCPFCGAQPLIIEELGDLVHCARGCGSRAPSKETWNRRATPPTPDAAEGAGELEKALATISEMKEEQRLFDEDLGEKQRTLDRLAELMGLPMNVEISQTDIELFWDRHLSATPKPAPGAVRLTDRDDNSCITRHQLKNWVNSDYVAHIGGLKHTIEFLLARLDALAAPVPPADGAGEKRVKLSLVIEALESAANDARKKNISGFDALTGIAILLKRDNPTLPPSATRAAEPVAWTPFRFVQVAFAEFKEHELRQIVDSISKNLTATPPVRGEREAAIKFCVTVVEEECALSAEAGKDSDYERGVHEVGLAIRDRLNCAIRNPDDLSLPVQSGAGERVLMPLDLSDEQADAALRATAVWLEVKGSQLTVNREKMKARYRNLVKFILSGQPSDEITPDQFAWLNERAAERRLQWADHAARQPPPIQQRGRAADAPGECRCLARLKKGDRVVVSLPRPSYGASPKMHDGQIVGESHDKTCWIVKRDQRVTPCAYHKDFCNPPRPDRKQP